MRHRPDFHPFARGIAVEATLTSAAPRRAALDSATADFFRLSLFVSAFLAGGYLLFWRPLLARWIF